MVLPVLSGRDTAITVSVGATNALYAALLRVLLIISAGRAVKNSSQLIVSLCLSRVMSVQRKGFISGSLCL